MNTRNNTTGWQLTPMEPAQDQQRAAAEQAPAKVMRYNGRRLDVNAFPVTRIIAPVIIVLAAAMLYSYL